MIKLQVIVGSTREGRAADKITPWLVRRAKERSAFDVEIVDLRDWPLPMFQETLATIGDRTNPTYSTPLVKEWNAKIASGDAYVMITPEYNHSISGVLKNAIDSVFVSYAFRNKPAMFVSYSGGVAAGARAIEHLAHIAIEAELVPLRNTIIIPMIGEAFDADGNPTNRRTEIAADIALDDLLWWSTLLNEGRARGVLPPGTTRFRQALAADAKK